MTIEVSIGWIWSVILCLLRLAPVFAFTPVLGGMQVPNQVKVMFLLLLAATLISAQPPAAVFATWTTGTMISAAMIELASGALLAFGVHTAFAAFDFAGKVLDIQMGFGLGTVFDPITRKPSPLIGSAFGMFAVTSFFLLDLHHHLIREFTALLEVFPVGTPVFDHAVGHLTTRFGGVFLMGLSLAAPVVFLLFLLDIGLAVMSRSVPQLNVLFLGAPIKIAVGLALLFVLVPRWGSMVRQVFAHMLSY